ncbi:Hypothetical predicted protein [Olea europaea subsp. europaea]|uniref:Scarecrow-like protein 9 n=2 Tax=Olea europaea subsp. europaea TaxID=158383 RepID=A0A8S0PVF6_OLEEU|nr:Hypothetical predicted protein [Olea europaea subsp. europaea]
MDPRFRGISSFSKGIPLGNQSVIELSNGKPVNGSKFEMNYPDQRLVDEHRFLNNFEEHDVGGVQLLPNEPFLNNTATSSFVGIEDDYQEDCDLSDAILRYINQTLMEEDMEDKTHMLQESLDLQAKEKSFYDVLGKKYPPSPEQILPFVGQYGERIDDYSSGVPLNSTSSSSDASGYLIDVVDSRRINGFSDSPISSLQVPDMYSESQSFWNFTKGVEGASKFLPNRNELLDNRLPFREPIGECDDVATKVEMKDVAECLPSESRRNKNPHTRDIDLEEERVSKQPSIYTESNIPEEEFSIVLLHSMGEGEKKLAAYRADLRNATSKSVQQSRQTKGSRGKGRGKKQNNKKEVIDLRTLLINCAQAVAADDRRSANELLKQIRQHSSPCGDGNQRLSYYFADGLQARLAGTGSQIHKALVSKRTTAADYLKAFHLYLASSPFWKISSFVSNKTIQLKAEKATRVHVIDFGILYGFQWPTFLQRIAGRKYGPPSVRITGVEFPQPGFKPAERIEETGRRLAYYAEIFNVPFEYNAIAQRWETIKIEDLKIEDGEFLIVNCLYRTQNLFDETVVAQSSRAIVFNMFRKINPDIFIHGIVNGAYSAPFFVTRFREVLFHFSALFDMLEVNVPREKPERLLIERDIFGREALNVIACEGWERVERPETYKQWQVRVMKAGFSQIPFEREIMDVATYKVRSGYHKDFVIDEDSQWLLLGWKGRTICALSCWKPF